MVAFILCSAHSVFIAALFLFIMPLKTLSTVHATVKLVRPLNATVKLVVT